MTLQTQILADRDAILLKPADGFTCSVNNLRTQQPCTGLCFGNDVNADSHSGLSNIAKSVLWIPIEITNFQQEDKLLITFNDGETEEFTVTACGGRFGGFRKVELVQTRVTRTRQAVSVVSDSPFQNGLSQVAEP